MIARLFAPSSSVALITGANRGIGLALVREYLGRGWSVIATARDPAQADALAALKDRRLVIEALDVASAASVAALKRGLAGQPIDVLINNAGVFDDDKRLGALDYGEWRDILDVNVLGQFRVTETLLGNVLESSQRKIVALSSALGSIAGTVGGRYAYRSSKAALNMGFRSMAKDLAEQEAIVAVLSPGLVDTDLTRALDKPKITAETSARGLADVIAQLDRARSGMFLRYDGSVVDW